MAYTTAAGLSWCEVDGHVVFLDVAGDRYFRLQRRDEIAFCRLAGGLATSADDRERLAARGVIGQASSANENLAAAIFEVPRRSAVEDFAPSAPSRGRLTRALIATKTTLATYRALQRGTLESTLNLVADELPDAPNPSPQELSVHGVVSAALDFGQYRRFIPIAPACLLDSLALSRFLSRSGLRARVVLGVTLQPFAAHCWVQLGDVVLNDTVSNAAAHTPIKVIG